MECSKCNNGRIHVVTLFSCNCGHHMLFCDKCFSSFIVPCGAPNDASALPPEHPIEEYFVGESQEIFAEACRGMFAESPEECPLLEDFKLSLSSRS